MENNKSFLELYNDLYSKHFEELEEYRKKQKKIAVAFLIVFGVIFLSVIFTNILHIFLDVSEPIMMIIPMITPVIFVTFFLSVIIIAIVKGTKTNLKKERTYADVFKEKIIKPVLNQAIPGGIYSPHEGLSRDEYRAGKWETWDRYRSEDKIVANLVLPNNEDVKLTMSEVLTESESTDSDGNTTYTTIFHGLAGYMNIPKDIGCNISVVKNGVAILWNKKNKVEMDMAEFEKVFDVMADDKIKTMQLLTADVMADFIDIVKTTNVKFEFKIMKNVIHIRFHTGGLFEPFIFKSSMQYEKLKEYYDIVIRVKNTCEKICNIINETEM